MPEEVEQKLKPKMTVGRSRGEGGGGAWARGRPSRS